MSNNIEISEARVYVGTYAKYNDGSLFGQWLDLNQFSDATDFYDACAKLHDDEEDPEFMFQDWENIPNGLISECSISDNLFELQSELEYMEDNRVEAFFIWCNNDHTTLSSVDVHHVIATFNSQYIGEYNSEEDFATEYVENNFDLSDFAKQYFDYKRYATDLFHCDYWFSDGHVFTC